MTKFEDQLRAGLHDAAHVRWFRRPSRLIAAAATAAVVVVGGAGLLAALNHHESPPQSASCAAELELGGHRYAAVGDLTRIPKPGPRLGTATIPPCADGKEGGQQVTAYRVADVSPQTAVLADGAIWLNTSAASPPAAQPCTSP